MAEGKNEVRKLVDPGSAPTVQDLQKARMQLGRDVTSLLRDFELKFGVSVTRVRLETSSISGRSRRTLVDATEIDIEI